MRISRVEPGAILTLVGDYRLSTYQPGEALGPPLESVLHLDLAPGGDALVGTDEIANVAGTSPHRHPVGSRENVLLVGQAREDEPPSRYEITDIHESGFSGTWATYQPAWLRAKQPQTPEWVGGRFVARRTAVK